MTDKFMIDLTDIGSSDKEKLDKAVLLAHFQDLINGKHKRLISLK
ncbi:hypothetical protein P4S63_24955 [Pseudoalteromonas sp. B193]